MKRFWLALVLAVLACVVGLGQRTLVVPDDYSTIQGAVDAAGFRDSVLVRPGRYRESVIIQRPVRLFGEDAPSTIIESPTSDSPVIRVDTGMVYGATAIESITIRNGGIGVLVSSIGPVRIAGCIVALNEVGILVRGSDVTVTDCFLWENQDVGIELWPNAPSAGQRFSLQGNEITYSKTGVLLRIRGELDMSRNSIGICGRAVDVAAAKCGWTDEVQGSLLLRTLTVRGTANRLHGGDMPICPPADSSPWPAGLVAQGFQEAVASAMELYLIARDLALDHPERALVYLEAAAAKAQAAECSPLLADVWLLMGALRLGRSAEEALRELLACLEIAEVRGMHWQVAAASKLLGNLQLDRGDYVAAHGNYAAAAAAFLLLDDWHEWVACANLTGATYAQIGRYEEAIWWFEGCRDVASREGLNAQWSKCTANLGTAYMQLGLPGLAMGFFRDAYDGLTAQTDPSDSATLLMHLGMALHGLGELLEAEACLRRAIVLYDSLPSGVSGAMARGNLGILLAGTGRYEEALGLYREAEPVFAWNLDWMGHALTLMNIGILFARMDEHEQALALYRDALGSLARVEDPDGDCLTCSTRWLVYYNRARSLEAADRVYEAHDAYLEAARDAEAVREQMQTEYIKLAWGEHTKHVYERLVDLLYRMGQGQEAFPYAERSRARTFLDLLAQGPVGTLEHVEDEGIRSGVVEAAVIEADLWEVIGDLPEDTAVLEYFTTDKAVYLWVITRGVVRDPIKIEVDRGVLLDQVRRFREAIETPVTTANEAAVLRTVLEQARDLYDLVLSPVAETIAGYLHLVIIPSGPLHYLPFAALYDCPGCAPGAMLVGGEGSYLVERFTLSYLPSLTTLKYAERQGRASTPEPTFLGLADPDAGDPRFSRLPQAQVEVQTIATQFPEEGRTVYVDLQATEEVLRAQASGARYVILSTHGSFNPHNPMHSFLLLAPSGDTRETDGRLYTYEVFGLDLRADLVTLSACETLLPSLQEAERQVRTVRGADADDTAPLPSELLERITAGDELVGLTRAFIYAGTPTVLSTLWSVYDVPTRDLMVGFYENLGQAEAEMNKAQALQEAQVALLTREDESGTRRYRHPVYWAAFTLYGDWR